MRRITLKRKRDYFLRILKTYLLLMALPVFLFICAFFYVSSTYKKEINESARNDLKSTYLTVDNRLQEMQQLAKNAIASSNLFLSMQNLSEISLQDRYSFYELSQTLKGYCSTSFSDIFLYLPKVDTVISGIGTTGDSSTYYSSYYKDNRLPYNDWISSLSADEQELFSPVYTSPGSPTILYTYNFASGYPYRKNASSTIGIVFNPKIFKTFLKNENKNYYKSDICLYNSLGEVLYTSNDILAEETTADIINTTESQEHKFQSGNYMIHSFLHLPPGVNTLFMFQPKNTGIKPLACSGFLVFLC